MLEFLSWLVSMIKIIISKIMVIIIISILLVAY